MLFLFSNYNISPLALSRCVLVGDYNSFNFFVENIWGIGTGMNSV
mgnify:CR=1 FL=1